jgi:hypothetical protein
MQEGPSGTVAADSAVIGSRLNRSRP